MGPLDLPPAPAGRRLLVIYNPVAGRRRRPRFEAALARLRALGCSLSLRETRGPGEAKALARAAGPGDGDLLVAAGGDGTVNEVVNGLVAGPHPAPLPLAILPLGTSNVLAREIGLGGDPAAAALAAARGPARPVCLGRIRRPDEAPRHFLAMAGVGFDARVVAAVGPAAKRRLGRAAYVLEAIRQAPGFPRLAYRVVVDGMAHEAGSVIVAKAAHYGGPFVIAPAARLDNPGFQVCLFQRGGPWQVPRYAFGLVSGRLPRMAGFRMVAGRHVRIEGAAPDSLGDPIQCDGDVTAHLPADVETVEGALSLVHPPAAEAS